MAEAKQGRLLSSKGIAQKSYPLKCKGKAWQTRKRQKEVNRLSEFKGMKPDAWRRARSKTQEQCAEKLKIHPNTYRALEAEPSKFSFQQGKELAEFLNVPLDLIIFLP